MSKLMMVMALVLAAGVAAAQGVLINEVDADTESTDILEFVELFGDAQQAADLMPGVRDDEQIGGGIHRDVTIFAPRAPKICKN